MKNPYSYTFHDPRCIDWPLAFPTTDCECETLADTHRETVGTINGHHRLCEYHGETMYDTRPCTCAFLARIRADEREKAARRVAAKRNYAFTDDVFGDLIIRELALDAARGGEEL